MAASPEGAAPTGGLGDAAHQVLANLVDLGRTRLELVTVELEEERLRVARLLALAVVTLFLLFVATVLVAAWIVLLFDPAYRVTALGVLGALFLAAAGGVAWRWHRLATAEHSFLHATLAELRHDAVALRGNQALP